MRKFAGALVKAKYPLVHPVDVESLRALQALLNNLLSVAEENIPAVIGRYDAELGLPALKNFKSNDADEEWRNRVRNFRARYKQARPSELDKVALEKRIGQIVHLAYSDQAYLSAQDQWVQVAVDNLFGLGAMPVSWQNELAKLFMPRLDNRSTETIEAIGRWKGVYESFRHAHHPEFDLDNWETGAATTRIIGALIEIDPLADAPMARFRIRFARYKSKDREVDVSGVVIADRDSLYFLGNERNPNLRGYLMMAVDHIGDSGNQLIPALFMRRHSKGSHFASRTCLRKTEAESLEEYEMLENKLDIFSDNLEINDEILEHIDNYVILNGRDVLMIEHPLIKSFRKQWETTKRT